MTKNEYMDKLKASLEAFDEEIREEIISDYEEHFEAGEASGKTDEEIAEELGNIEDLVKELKSFTDSDDNNESNRTYNFDNFFDSKAIEKGLEDFAKGFAGFLGSMAATITKGADKFSGEAENVAKDFAKNFESVADIVADKSSAIADAVVEKSTAFAKEVAENYKNNNGVAFDFGCKNAKKDDSDADAYDDVDSSTDEETDSDKYPCKEECKKLIVETDCGDIIAKNSEDGDFKFDYKNDGTANQQLAYKFDWTQNGDTIKVACKKRPGVTNFFNALPCPDITVTVNIPEGLELVEILTVSGDVNAEEIAADTVKINTVSGDALATGLNTGFASAVSVSGDLTFVGLNTTAAVVKSVSGDVTVEGSVGSMNVGTTSGDVEAKIKDTKEVTAATVSGDTNIHLDNAEGFRASLKTASGDLSLQCKEESCKYIKSGTYTLGDGSVQISASSVSGCVNVNA